MPDLLSFLLIALPALGVTFLLLKWGLEQEKRAQSREWMKRVYYLRPRTRDDVPEWKRQSEPKT